MSWNAQSLHGYTDRAECADDTRARYRSKKSKFLKKSVRKECDGNGYAPSAVAAAPLREIDIALQPLLASLANEAQEIRAFGLGTATANQNDQPEMRSFCSELQKVVAVASDHHTLIALCGRKNGFIGSGAREKISEPDNVVFVPLQSVLDRGRHVVVEEKFHFTRSSICGSASRSISA